VAVSLGFLMLFLAYNSLQNYVTSLLEGNLGNESLAVLYISVCAFVFSAPHIVSRMGEKNTMIFGSICYLAYMGSLIHPIRGVVLAAAVVIGAPCLECLPCLPHPRARAGERVLRWWFAGFGAAILWVAVGSYITKNTIPEEYGKTSGLFWGIFQLSGIFGNLFAYFIFAHLHGNASLFVALTCAGTLGALIFFFIPKERSPERATNEDGAPRPARLTFRLPLSPTRMALAAHAARVPPPPFSSTLAGSIQLDAHANLPISIKEELLATVANLLSKEQAALGKQPTQPLPGLSWVRCGDGLPPSICA
jgi:MFS family permease